VRGSGLWTGLGPGTHVGPGLLDDDITVQESSGCQKEACTLDKLCFILGDYLCITMMLPKDVQVNFSGDASSAQKGASGAPSSAPANGWKSGGGGLGRSVNASSALGAVAPGAGHGGGHWCGGLDAPLQPARGCGERGPILSTATYTLVYHLQ
jgi:histone deacetylase complex subunit SAP18